MVIIKKIALLLLIVTSLNAMEQENISFVDLPAEIQEKIVLHLIRDAGNSNSSGQLCNAKLVSIDFNSFVKRLIKLKKIKIPAAQLWNNIIHQIRDEIITESIPDTSVVVVSKGQDKLYCGTKHGRFYIVDISTGKIILSKKMSDRAIDSISINKNNTKALIYVRDHMHEDFSLDPNPESPYLKDIGIESKQNEIDPQKNLFIIDLHTGLIDSKFMVDENVLSASFNEDETQACLKKFEYREDYFESDDYISSCIETFGKLDFESGKIFYLGSSNFTNNTNHLLIFLDETTNKIFVKNLRSNKGQIVLSLPDELISEKIDEVVVNDDSTKIILVFWNGTYILYDLETHEKKILPFDDIIKIESLSNDGSIILQNNNPQLIDTSLNLMIPILPYDKRYYMSDERYINNDGTMIIYHVDSGFRIHKATQL